MRAPKRPNPQTPTSLRGGRAVRFVHHSIGLNKDGTVTRGTGKTYDRRRNANKRLSRRADVRWRVAERSAR